MLRKMRWRFVGAAMVAFTTVVLVLLCCINIWNYRNMTARLDGTLAVLFEIDEKGRINLSRKDVTEEEKK